MNRSTNLLVVLTIAITTQLAPPAGRAQFGGVFGGRESNPNETKLETPTPKIKIFELENADAREIANILNQLLGVNAVVDPRLNTLIIRDESEESLAVVEAVIVRLDRPAPPNVRAAGGGPAVDPFEAGEVGADIFGPEPGTTDLLADASGMNPLNPTAAVAGTAEIVQQQEQRGERIAREYRRIQASGADKKQLDRARVELRGAVQSAFQARQQLQRTQLVAFVERLKRVESMINTREKIKEQIVDRRVEELLDPRLRWDAMSSNSNPAPSSFAGENAAKATSAPPVSPENTAPSRTGSRIITPTPTQIVPGPLPEAPSSSSGRVASAPTADMGVLKAKLDAAKARLEAVDALFQAGQATVLEAQTARADVKIAEAELAAAERRFQAELEVLEIELRQAEARLQLAMHDFQRVEKLKDEGVIPGSEFTRLKAAYDEARLAHQLAEARLKAHQRSNDSAVREPETPSGPRKAPPLGVPK